MPAKKNDLITRFLIWRAKHISQKQFIYLLSVLVGFTSGLGAAILKNATHFFQNLLEGNLIKSYHDAFYFLSPVVGLALVFVIINFGIRRKVSHGIPSTLYAISKKKGLMKRYQMFGSILTAPITVGFGGSVGLEGPTVATGAAISSNLSRLFHINQSQRTLLIGCAAAGALSSIFKAPIAAIIFAVEVFSLDLTLMSLLPLLLASLSAIITSYFFFGAQTVLPFQVLEPFLVDQLPFFMLLGLVAGITSIYFASTYDWIHKRFEAISRLWVRLVLGGALLGVLIYFFPPLYGEGFSTINKLLYGSSEQIFNNTVFSSFLDHPWSLVLLLGALVMIKVVATSITFGAGGVGGIFAPSLFMGSVMGFTVARIINLTGFFTPVSEANFALVGMGGLMAGVLHAPLTAIFLIAELTGGYTLFIPLMITAALGYGITKWAHPHSVYTMELGRKGELITHNKDHAVLTLMDMESVVERNFIPVHPKMTLGQMIHEAVVPSSRNIFPVTHPETGALLGIVLLDDIRSIMFDPTQYDSIKVRDLMHEPPEVIDVDQDNMVGIMQKFQESSAWNLPLVKEGQYYGFISKSKLLTAYRRKLIHFTI
jgi:CIC family chloride channel protein